MDKGKLIRIVHNGFTIAAVEGVSEGFQDKYDRYKSNGKFKRTLSLSPLFINEKDEQDIFFANVYGDLFCTANVWRDYSKEPNTKIICSGIKNLPLELLFDISDAFGLVLMDPSDRLLETTITTQLPLCTTYHNALSMINDETLVSRLICEELMRKEERYKEEAMRRCRANN